MRLSLRAFAPMTCLLALLSAALGTSDAWGQEELTPQHPATVERLQDSFALAMTRAQVWANGVEVDAVALQAHQPPVKGKKKLAEWLDLQLLFYERSDDGEREEIRARVRELAAQLRTPDYQDLLTCTEAEFEANSLSYLRVYILLDAFGLLEDADRDAAKLAQPRFDAEMAKRGAWQRAMFSQHYDQLGLEKPEALENTALSGGLVEQRKPLAEFDLAAAYSITHEVFAAYDYGRRHEQDLFDDKDLMYLQMILLPLQRLAVQKRGFDLMGEVVSCNTYLSNIEDSSYRAAVEIMLTGQNENGSWGDYEEHRESYGDTLEAQAYLHTTLVCVAALIDVFEKDVVAAP